MFKVSFAKNYKIVQKFNERVVIVEIIGKIYDSNLLPMLEQRAKENGFFINYNIIGIKTKAICAPEDTFDPVLGERIAESRAKIALYKFMYETIRESINAICKVLMGCSYDNALRSRHSFDSDNMFGAMVKYKYLYLDEKDHLNNLLK